MDDRSLHILVNKIQSYRYSEPYRAFKSLSRPRIIFFVYHSNYLDLKKELRLYYNNPIEVENSLGRRSSQKLLIKQFQNVLAGARVYTDKYVENVLEDSFHCFMKELRNYTIHHSFFPLSSRWRMGGEGGIRYETIQTSRFQDYLTSQIENSKKKKVGLEKALMFLSSKEEIVLNKLFEEYFLKLRKHYNSFMLSLINDKKTELEKLFNISMDLNKEMKAVGLNSPNLLNKTELRYLKYLLSK